MWQSWRKLKKLTKLQIKPYHCSLNSASVWWPCDQCPHVPGVGVSVCVRVWVSLSHCHLCAGYKYYRTGLSFNCNKRNNGVKNISVLFCSSVLMIIKGTFWRVYETKNADKLINNLRMNYRGSVAKVI